MKEKSTLFFLFLSVLQSMICFAGNEIDSTVNAFRKMPNDTNKVILMTSYANQINYQNPKYGKAIAEEALNISKKLDYDFGIMKANSILAFCFLNFSEFDSARICLTQSIEKAKEINHLEGLGHGYTGLGNVFYFQSLLPSAIESWLKALVINEQRKDTNGMVGILSNIGAVYLDLGNYSESMAYFKKALHLNLACRSLRNRTEIYSNIATIYSRTNRKELALKYHLNALSIAKQVKSIDLQAACMADLVNQYRNKKNPVLALDYAKQSLDLSRIVGNQDNIAFAWLLIGQCYWDIYDQNNKELIQKIFGGNKVKCLNVSLMYHDSAIHFYEESGMLDRLKLVYDSKSSVQESLGDGMGAYESFKKASALKDSLFNMELDRKLTQNTMQYEFDKKEAINKIEQEKKVSRERNIRNIVLAGLLFTLIFAFVVLSQRNKINKARKRSEELLLNILPEEVAEELKLKGEAEARLIEEVTVLFTDFKGFTALSEKLTPKELVKDLHECFTAFDNIMQRYGLEKIKTIGDAYMAAGGLPTPNATHASDVVKAALEIRQFMEEGKSKKMANQEPYFEIRIGVHTGPVVAGIVGVKKFSYDIWGDTVNTASRMESSGSIGKVNISESTYQKIKDLSFFRFEPRGKIAAKGKGEIEMYYAEGQEDEASTK